MSHPEVMRVAAWDVERYDMLDEGLFATASHPSVTREQTITLSRLDKDGFLREVEKRTISWDDTLTVVRGVHP